MRDARQHGIETVFQDLALVGEQSVYHNLFLNREQTRGGWFRSQQPGDARHREAVSGRHRSRYSLRQHTGGEAVRQENIKILLLDEPLAAMGAKETSLIIALIKSLSKKSNISIIVIDHNYTHLFEICDRINVIQHGQVTVDKSLSEIKLEELIEFMVQSFRRDVATGGAK